MTTTWILHDKSRGRKREFDNRAEAQDKKQDLQSLGADSLSLYPKNESEDEDEDDGDEIASDGVEPELVDQTEEAKADGGSAESVPSADTQSIPDSVDSDEPPSQPTQEEMEADPDILTGPEDLDQGSEALDQMGESLDTDPLDILPAYMITHVDGKPSLNKRGVSVLAYHYGVSVVERETVAYPHETDYESAIYEITVETEDGRRFVGSGEAHVDETPKHQLLRMAETRAYKRAVIFATGTGIVGYQEVMEELQ